MKNIVPGGHYSYDSANKQIWLSYEYYSLGVENVYRIKNLTKNLDFYNSDNPRFPLVVENGCITHSYPAAGDSGDKIQIVLRTPITDSLTELTATEGVITVETDGKVLVLPTEEAAVLPSFNEYVLNPNRLTIAESPLGGLKSGSPDYCPGTLYTPTDGVYLTDVAGNNSTKTLTAGMLIGVNGLTVDVEGHTITEEFIVANTGESNNPTVIDSLVSGWTQFYSTEGTITYANGTVTMTNAKTDSNGSCIIKAFNYNFLGDHRLVRFRISANTDCTLFFMMGNGPAAVTKAWMGVRFPLVANTQTTFVLPYLAPVSTVGTNPSRILGEFTVESMVRLYIGVTGVPYGSIVSYSISDLELMNENPAYIELQTPNNLAPSSLTTQCWTGTAYETVRTDSLDGAYANVAIDTTKAKFLDGTLLDHVYGTGLGRAVFPKGVSGATVNGSTGTMTYSANQGTSKRIGLMVSLPPSDGGRTNLNKIRLRTILTYAPDVYDNYSASYDFADSTNTSYGLQNLAKPWIALYDPITSEVDFYLFTHRPKNLEFKKDESGTIYEVTLYPGNGSIYWGRVHYSDLTVDSDSNTIPDCLEASIAGSVTKFLENYSMVIP